MALVRMAETLPARADSETRERQLQNDCVRDSERFFKQHMAESADGRFCVPKLLPSAELYDALDTVSPLPGPEYRGSYSNERRAFRYRNSIIRRHSHR